jgi:hypothetical protein
MRGTLATYVFIFLAVSSIRRRKCPVYINLYFKQERFSIENILEIKRKFQQLLR